MIDGRTWETCNVKNVFVYKSAVLHLSWVKASLFFCLRTSQPQRSFISLSSDLSCQTTCGPEFLQFLLFHLWIFPKMYLLKMYLLKSHLLTKTIQYLVWLINAKLVLSQNVNPCCFRIKIADSVRWYLEIPGLSHHYLPAFLCCQTWSLYPNSYMPFCLLPSTSKLSLKSWLRSSFLLTSAGVVFSIFCKMGWFLITLYL